VDSLQGPACALACGVLPYGSSSFRTQQARALGGWVCSAGNSVHTTPTCLPLLPAQAENEALRDLLLEQAPDKAAAMARLNQVGSDPFGQQMCCLPVKKTWCPVQR